MMTKIYSSSCILSSLSFARHTHFIKHFATTTMTSNDQTSKTKSSDKTSDNLLAKRFHGLEDNIWCEI